jgi:AraC family transcriptional regulator
MTPTIKTSEAIIFAGRNGTFPIGPSPGIKDLWVKLMEDFGKIEGQVGLKAYGVCHAFDGKTHMDYMAAVQVTNAGAVPGYLHTLIVPARKVAVFAHQGKIETLPQTWAKIFDTWLPEQKLAVAGGAQFEVYSEDFDSDAGTGSIEIHIPVK